MTWHSRSAACDLCSRDPEKRRVSTDKGESGEVHSKARSEVGKRRRGWATTAIPTRSRGTGEDPTGLKLWPISDSVTSVAELASKYQWQKACYDNRHGGLKYEHITIALKKYGYYGYKSDYCCSIMLCQLPLSVPVSLWPYDGPVPGCGWIPVSECAFYLSSI